MKIITTIIRLLYPEKKPHIGSFSSHIEAPCISLTLEDVHCYKKKSFDAILAPEFSENYFALVRPGGFLVLQNSKESPSAVTFENYTIMRQPCITDNDTLSVRAAVLWSNLNLYFSDDRGIESQMLVEHCLQENTSFLYTFPEKKMTLKEDCLLQTLLEKRQQRIPISYILQCKNFMSLSFAVDENVLIPRPETELIVEYVMETYQRQEICGLDLATGSGCIAISILHYLPQAFFVASDLSFAALQKAKENAIVNGVYERIRLVNGDMLQPFDAHQQFDVIVSNPPYIAFHDYENLCPELKYEPQMALTAEEDGLYFYRTILEAAYGYLKPGGELIMEMGYLQFPQIKAMIPKELQFKDVIKDHAGIDRVIIVESKF
ncbi:peptide chain release factor N(5)-glutamine methyltransferase [Candidatus Uabimicrobium amorphum]|uniref:peptide chain release factor N(5)-glutamine methyltransferase n=1 Tax=Uabimicrobium amorphum TaxID=2596890 RepID=A0A5S9INP5_UABAM|nr:peptide chain release factor N(5)-glutamine methyltransferase [Candidatus Uabimicrobium amorphum]BBM85258.1 release factor glutamine methyltransferase [Candidatus Uabimicrobium amorphum]